MHRAFVSSPILRPLRPLPAKTTSPPAFPPCFVVTDGKSLSSLRPLRRLAGRRRGMRINKYEGLAITVALLVFGKIVIALFKLLGG